MDSGALFVFRLHCCESGKFHEMTGWAGDTTGDIAGFIHDAEIETDTESEFEIDTVAETDTITVMICDVCCVILELLYVG